MPTHALSSPHSPKTYLRSFWHRQCLVPSLGIALSASMSILVPWCLVQVMDAGIAAGNLDVLWNWLLAAAGAQALAGFMRFWGTCAISKYGLQLEKNRLKSLYTHIMQADLRMLPDIAQGSAIGQMMFASNSERHFLETLYLQGIPLLITTIGTGFALLALSPVLTLCSFSILPIAALLWLWLKQRIRPAARLDYENQESLYRHLVDTFQALIPIRALHQNNKFCRQLDEIASSCQESSYLLQFKLAVQGPFYDFLQALVLIAVFGLGGYWVIHDALSIGALLGFQLYLARLFTLLRGSTGLFGAWQHYLEGRTRSDSIENLPPAMPPIFQHATSPEILRLDKLSFRFETHEVWHEKSLIIHEGERHAILLPSGGGKTTLARCILGLYPINGGSISLPDASSECIGFVPQENVLFDGSLRENIGLMTENLDESHYSALLHACALEDLAARFQDSPIGERGSRLSGGEQRRVMLARALASNPKLLVIDQMASELEPELCQTIFVRIQAYMPKLGILYLGHRMPEWDN